MTTRRHQLVTREGRLRLFRAAGAHILEASAPDDVHRFAATVSARLYEVGLPYAGPVVLAQYAQALDHLDGLTTGRYDLAYLIPDLTGYHDQERARDALETRLVDDVDFLERLAVLGPRLGR